MFWNKKPKDSSLPDLPTPTNPFIKSEIPPIHARAQYTMPNPVPRQSNASEEPDEVIGDDSEEENEVPERHNLPSFPDSPIKKGFSQTAIKHAIDTEESSEYNMENENTEEKMQFPVNRNFKTVEMDSNMMKETKIPYPPQRNERNEMSMRRPEIVTDSKKDVFVKIDKFQSAKKSLTSAQEKVEEIESMLRKIREVRMREDQELTAWERDIESLKVRIEEISKNIFEKL